MVSQQNQEQFIRLLMLNDKRIYTYILSLVPNTADADDIMQETSAVMWRKFDTFTKDKDFVAWGISIARFQILSYFKKRKHSKVRFSEELIQAIEEEVEKTFPQMEQRLDALKTCLLKLSAEDKNILKLRYEKNYTLENIGAHISKSTRATYYCLVRLHKLLLGCIKRKLIEERIC